MLVYVYNFHLFEFLAAILEKSLFMFEPFPPLPEKIGKFAKESRRRCKRKACIVYFYLFIYYFFKDMHRKFEKCRSVTPTIVDEGVL